MAVAQLHTEWLFHLKRRGLFQGRRSLFDLGPQDVLVSRAWLEGALARHEGSPQPDRVARICGDGNMPHRNCQLDFYSIFGITDYASTDLDDDRATYRWDLNYPPEDAPQFDVVTDFGTIEHVYDMTAAIRTMHRLLKPGGLALHAVPVFAYPNHGFHTPNPNLFPEFARANGYKLADFSYVDNMFVRDQIQAKRIGEGFDFDALPIRVTDMVDTRLFINKVIARYHANFCSADTRDVMAERAPQLHPSAFPTEEFDLCYIFDIQFVALVKPMEERPLVAPIQRMEGVLPLDATLAPPEPRSPREPMPPSAPAISPPIPASVTAAGSAHTVGGSIAARESEPHRSFWQRLVSGR